MFKDESVLESANARNPNRSSATTTAVLQRVALTVLAVLLIGQSVGCNIGKSAFGDAVMLSLRDAVWAKRAYNLRFRNCDRQYADHFQNGFCSGYSDVCGGGDGYVPALPPAEYRSFEYQCEEGSECVNAWFEGYPAGVAAAKKDKAGSYHNVAVSRLIAAAVTQENSDNILPQDVPVVDTDGRSNATMSAPPVPAQSRNFQLPYAAPPVIKASPASYSETDMPLPLSLPVGEPINNNAQQNNIPPIVTGSGVIKGEGNPPMSMEGSYGWNANGPSQK